MSSSRQANRQGLSGRTATRVSACASNQDPNGTVSTFVKASTALRDFVLPGALHQHLERCIPIIRCGPKLRCLALPGHGSTQPTLADAVGKSCWARERGGAAPPCVVVHHCDIHREAPLGGQVRVLVAPRVDAGCCAGLVPLHRLVYGVNHRAAVGHGMWHWQGQGT